MPEKSCPFVVVCYQVTIVASEHGCLQEISKNLISDFLGVFDFFTDGNILCCTHCRELILETMHIP